MVEYIEFYETTKCPLITENYKATVDNNGQYGTIRSGAIDFSKPFELSVDFFNVPDINNGCIFFIDRSDVTDGRNSMFNISNVGGSNYIRLNNVTGAQVFYQDFSSFDKDKTYNFKLTWDGELYIALLKATDGTVLVSTSGTGTDGMGTAKAFFGYGGYNNVVLDVDLKSFVVRHLDGNYEYRLVEEVKPIVDPGTVKGKLEYLENTKDLIIKSLRSKGVDISDDTTFRQYVNYILKSFNFNSRWIIDPNSDKCRGYSAPSGRDFGIYSSTYNYNISTSNIEIFNTRLDNPNRIAIKTNASSSNWQTVYSEKYRNSIFTFYRNGSNSAFYTVVNRKYDKVDPLVGYFVTDELGRIIKNVPVYDDAYAYKPDKYVENFLTYNPSDMSVTIKAGDYQSCYTKPITEAIINVDTDKVLSFDESMAYRGYLIWRDADYNYSLQASVPSNEISISLLDTNNPGIPNYIISRKMRTTGDTNIRLYNNSSSSYYQNFTTSFVDINPNVLSSGTVRFRSGTSTTFGFANIGDQYIIRTEVGDGFRNNVNPDYIYEGLYANQPTSLTHTRQLTLLDGSTRLIDDGSNKSITVNELKNIRYIDDIYTVNSTTSSSANRTTYFYSLVSGRYTGAFSYGINIDTTYDRLNISGIDKNSKINLYINVGAGLVMEGFSNKPKYPIL